jgi:hypothetical protein
MAVGEAVLTTALMLGTECMMACPQTRHWHPDLNHGRPEVMLC